ncbi:unnamed protein product [Discula destructiva]
MPRDEFTERLHEASLVHRLLVETVKLGITIGRRLMAKLDTLSERLQPVFNELLRPRMRPLTILNLPDELLILVSRLIRDSLVEGSAGFHIVEGQLCDFQNIKNLRLTCHRLSNGSSCFLLRHISVAMTPNSLARLEAVSRHAYFSKSVLAVRINLEFYIPQVAESPYRFFNIALRYLQFRARVRRESLATHDEDADPRMQLEEEEELVQEQRIIKSWSDFIWNGEEPTDDQARDDVQALRRAHGIYRERTHEQEWLFKDREFSRTVAAAIARMPRATRLFLTDRKDCLRFNTDQSSRYEKSCADRFLDAVILRPCGWTGHYYDETLPPQGFREAPTWLLYDVLVEVSKAAKSRNPLKHLSIQFSDPTGVWCSNAQWKLTSQDQAHIQALVRPLEILEYGGLPALPDRTDDSDASLRCLASGDHLRQLELVMTSYDTKPISSLLPRIKRSNLRQLCLKNCSFHQSDLERLLSGFTNKQLGMVLSMVHLLSGTWADVLDLLQETAGFYSSLSLDEKSGAECASMTEGELEAISEMTPEESGNGYNDSVVNEYIHSGPELREYKIVVNPFRPAETEGTGGGDDGDETG